MSKVVKFLVSFGFIGYAPFWPGAFGSLAGILIAWFVHPWLSETFLVLTILGFALCRPAVGVYGKKDPQTFVLDEVSGIMLSVLWLPKDIMVYLTGYFLFRYLDTVKPGFIRKLEQKPSSLSIMWDDLAAGFITNIVLQILFRIIGV